MDLMKNYNDAIHAIYKHVGFTEDWVVCPISDCTDFIWAINGKTVKYAENGESFESDGNHYQDDIYTQRFYEK